MSCRQQDVSSSDVQSRSALETVETLSLRRKSIAKSEPYCCCSLYRCRTRMCRNKLVTRYQSGYQPFNVSKTLYGVFCMVTTISAYLHSRFLGDSRSFSASVPGFLEISQRFAYSVYEHRFNILVYLLFNLCYEVMTQIK